ncbi:class I SAM-dependent methyltransferase [Halomonas sp. CUBES01]|uniref:class I SAM-dependent methyltransferase n=1 Tax=Halomonas sp. CUBES01 TaxID=2897340 RepID=UPI001E4E9000|nr:class I SAM-dependent methyltransferase [Halomonas sp. CUBES01]MEC4766703.1 class I SAM-dependent methyltransferase [Halomonas sp. CUBES01]
MLLNNNPQLDTQRLSAKVRQRLDGLDEAPPWRGETLWQQSLEGQVVNLGSTRQCQLGRATDYASLLALPTPAFVEESCYYLLGQLPEYSQYHEHLATLLSGEEREKWLLSLAKQRDASQAALSTALPGLEKGLARARIKYLPKLGRVIRQAWSLLKLDDFRRRMQHFIHLQNARYDALLELHRQQAQTLAELQAAQGRLAAENAILTQRLSQQGAPTASAATSSSASHQVAASQQSLVMEDTEATPERDFYLALEARFRGSLSSIGELMKEHLPHLANTPPLHHGKALLDLGCGRGEWLALVEAEGYRAWGVDLNETNVKITRGRGLDVRYQDALTALAECDDDSLGMITSFHLIEHLSHQQLRTLLREALRALAPEGRLLLETPNPQNLLVGSCNFYLDPTHVRPIPPDFLQFLAEYSGFEHADIMPLHPVDPSLRLPDEGETSRRLNHYLYGPQDYAMLAVKAATTPPMDTEETHG